MRNIRFAGRTARSVRTMVFMVLVVGGVCAQLFAQSTDSCREVRAIRIAPIYAEARQGMLPVAYANKGDTCTVLGVHVDTTGTPWFGLSRDGGSTWSPARFWRYVAGGEGGAVVSVSRTDEDRKRRLRILRQHSGWPRRIVRAVREGEVCLDMTEEQLAAAWGEPFQRSSAFVLGLGSVTIRFFRVADRPLIGVVLLDGRVVGWTSD